jgi:hypothetical protein
VQLCTPSARIHGIMTRDGFHIQQPFDLGLQQHSWATYGLGYDLEGDAWSVTKGLGAPKAISFHSMHRSLRKLAATVFTALADHISGQ